MAVALENIHFDQSIRDMQLSQREPRLVAVSRPLHRIKGKHLGSFSPALNVLLLQCYDLRAALSWRGKRGLGGLDVARRRGHAAWPDPERPLHGFRCSPGKCRRCEGETGL